MEADQTLGRKEIKVTLGHAPTMTKRLAERKADEIMAKVSGQVYTIQSEVPFRAGARVPERQRTGRYELVATRRPEESAARNFLLWQRIGATSRLAILLKG